MRPVTPSEPPDYGPDVSGTSSSFEEQMDGFPTPIDFRNGEEFPFAPEPDLSVSYSQHREEFPPDPEAVLQATSYHDFESPPGFPPDEEEEGPNGFYVEPEDATLISPDKTDGEWDETSSEEEEDEEEEDEESHVPHQFVPVLSRTKNATRPQRAAVGDSTRTRIDTPLLYGHTASNSYGSVPASSLPSHRLDPVTGYAYAQSYELDEDLTIVITGHQQSYIKLVSYYILCVLTVGILYLLCRWFPKLELALTTRQCPLPNATIVSIKNEWGEIQTIPVERSAFSGTIDDIFPSSKARRARETLIGSDVKDESLRSTLLPTLTHFEYRYIRFILNPMIGMFEPNWSWSDPKWGSVRKVLQGIRDGEKVEERKLIFGRNEVDVREKGIFRLAVDEVLHPFFMFQIGSIVLWSLDDYYYYATCIFLISIVTATLTLLETRKTMRRLREISRFSCPVRVWRSGRWQILRSEDLVPGDVYEVTPPVFPCDSILLDGDCIVNESMLTGESVPVSKSAVSDLELRTVDFEVEDPAGSGRMGRWFLFCGTKIVRIRPGVGKGRKAGVVKGLEGIEEEGVKVENGTRGQQQQQQPGALALCVRTGFNTTKGSLVRSMLFPKPNKFKFYRDSFRFIGVLAIIASIGFLGSVYNFLQMKVQITMIIVRALDLLTIVVPPALPATMAIGTNFAISRLRKGDIYCTSPPRVNICGKLELIAFDKTGTLTQEGLDVLGFRFTVPMKEKVDSPKEVESGVPLRFSALYRSMQEIRAAFELKARLRGAEELFDSEDSEHEVSVRLASLDGHPNSVGVRLGGLGNDGKGGGGGFMYPNIVCAMATCHSIKVVEGELIGDPMDLKMFEFTGWMIEEGVPGVKREKRS
ncbi:hypothetical protein HK097_004753, partial [Rhizophlyctis rosea]